MFSKCLKSIHGLSYWIRNDKQGGTEQNAPSQGLCFMQLINLCWLVMHPNWTGALNKNNWVNLECPLVTDKNKYHRQVPTILPTRDTPN
jgi:hypothetical protein